MEQEQQTPPFACVNVSFSTAGSITVYTKILV